MKLVNRVARRLGYERRRSGFPHDVDKTVRTDLERVAPYTFVEVPGLLAFDAAVKHVAENNLPGAIVECGVWRGGASMLAALACRRYDIDRELWLYDTFEGMPPPSEKDKRWDGSSAEALLDTQPRENLRQNYWCVADRSDVERNLRSTGYERLRFVEGRVEDTIPQEVPESIAVLRIDVDWYEPTKHALENLVPHVSPGGILLLDDYGFWQGAQKATDEFLAGKGLFLHRVDATNRLVIL